MLPRRRDGVPLSGRNDPAPECGSCRRNLPSRVKRKPIQTCTDVEGLLSQVVHVKGYQPYTAASHDNCKRDSLKRTVG